MFCTALKDMGRFQKISVEKKGVTNVSMQRKEKKQAYVTIIFSVRKKKRDKKMGTLEKKLDFEKCY